MEEQDVEAGAELPSTEISAARHVSQSVHGLDEKGKTIEPEEIEYLYLNFDTPLPTPAGISSPQPGQLPPPEVPNLKQFMSPFLWSKGHKAMVTWISCAVTALAAFAAGEFNPESKILCREWKISTVVYELGITVFTTGFAIAPMVLAPFSEINGRRPMFISSGILFTGE